MFFINTIKQLQERMRLVEFENMELQREVRKLKDPNSKPFRPTRTSMTIGMATRPSITDLKMKYRPLDE